MKHLKFKVQVTPEQSSEIQKAIFEKRGQWADGTTDVKHLNRALKAYKLCDEQRKKGIEYERQDSICIGIDNPCGV